MLLQCRHILTNVLPQICEHQVLQLLFLRVAASSSVDEDIKKFITVGIIGLPNVGKSSIISSLKRSHVVNVVAIPGLTRSMQQEVHLDKIVKLLDYPGVVMLESAANDSSIALLNCKKIEIFMIQSVISRMALETLLLLQGLLMKYSPTYGGGRQYSPDFGKQLAGIGGKVAVTAISERDGGI